MPVCVLRTQQPSVEPAVEGHVSSQDHMQSCGQDPNHVRTSGLRMTVGHHRVCEGLCLDTHSSTCRLACKVPYEKTRKQCSVGVRVSVTLYS